jgi:hypothetical protein
VAEKDGTLTLTVNTKDVPDQPGNEHGTLVKGQAAPGSPTVEVPVVALDSSIRDHVGSANYIVPLLKVDTEGYDYFVMRGGARETLDRTSMIMWECSHLMKGVARVVEVAAFLAQFDFESFRLGQHWYMRLDDGVADGAFDDHAMWANCFSIKRGHPLRRALLEKVVTREYLEGRAPCTMPDDVVSAFLSG